MPIRLKRSDERRRASRLAAAVSHLAARTSAPAFPFERPPSMWPCKYRANAKETTVRHRLYERDAEEALEPHVLDEAELKRGLDTGVLVEDTRLRDALRTIWDPQSRRYLPHGETREPFPLTRPTILADALFAVDAATFADADTVRLQRDLDTLNHRQQELEQLTLIRTERRLRRFLFRDG